MKIIIIIVLIVLIVLLLFIPNKIIEKMSSSDMSNLLPDTGTSCDCPSGSGDQSTDTSEEIIPVNFDTSGPSTSTRSGLMVNNTPFKCIKGKGGCIDQIMTYDNNGLPQYNRTPDPPTQSFMISDKFHQKDNRRIINCPTGYNISSSKNHLCVNNNDNSIKCISNDNNIKLKNVSNCDYTNGGDSMTNNPPLANEFNFDQKCKDWCWSNPDCYAVTSNTNENGETMCYYYDKNIKNKNKFMKNVQGYNSYFSKKPKNIYPNDPINFTEKQITDQTPLYSNLNQITNPRTLGSYRNYTDCLKRSDLGEDNDLVINLSGKCQDQIGPGYVARADELCDAIPCSEEGYSRYKCKFEPLNTTNIFNIDLSSETPTYTSMAVSNATSNESEDTTTEDTMTEEFTNINNLSTLPLWKIGLVILIISIIFVIFFKKKN
jgi:hypothetical protein